MDLLKELHNLYEAEIPGTGLVEIKDVVENFPTKARKAILALLKTERLAINGLPFLANSDNDVIYKLGDKLKDEKFSTTLNFEAPYGDYNISVEYEDDTIDIRDSQMDYLGYDPRTNTLKAGYDIFIDESLFNEEWDKEFKNETGEEFDSDSPGHQEAFDHAWQQYLDYRAFLIVTVKVDDNGEIDIVDDEIGEGRLYPKGYQLMKAQGVVDVILD